MSYELSIDLGTTWTAAAVRRDANSRMVELSQRSTAIPSVVLLREDGEVLVGEAAERRAAFEPGRVAREFKRRIGDSTPLLLGGTPHSAEAVTARLARWVHDLVVEREGGPPDRIVLTHPANWGEFKLDLFRQAVVLARIDEPVTFVTEPEAAVLHYAAQERVDPGATVAVYDLGGGTFDAAVLRKGDAEADPFTFLGPPQGIERLGGIDFDEALFRHVLDLVGVDPDDLDLDEVWLAGLQRLRADCVAAKEVLSTDVDTSIPVLLPRVQTEVRVTRAEFEQMIRPTLADTLTVLERAVGTAGIEPDDLDRILLVGGSSRIPVVAELLASRFGRPLGVDAHPKHAVVLGALLTLAASGPGSHGTSSPATAAAADGDDAADADDAAAPPAADHDAAGSPTPTGHDDAGSPPATDQDAVDPGPADRQPDGDEPAAADQGAADRNSAAGSPPATGSRRHAALFVGVGVALALVAAVAVAVASRGGSTSSAEPTAAEEAAGAVSTTASTTTTESTTTESTTTESTTTESTTTTSSTTTTTTEAPPADGFVEGVRCSAVQELCADITGIRVVDGELEIDWAANFVPNVNGRNHVHFYWGNLSPLDAGAGGSGPWEVSDQQPHRAGTYGDAILLANRSADAPICVTVANPDHTVRDPAIYQCWDLPDEIG